MYAVVSVDCLENYFEEFLSEMWIEDIVDSGYQIYLILFNLFCIWAKKLSRAIYKLQVFMFNHSVDPGEKNPYDTTTWTLQLNHGENPTIRCTLHFQCHFKMKTFNILTGYAMYIEFYF